MDNNGKTAFETLIITSLAGILLVIAISNFLTSVRVAREVALTSELSNLRTAVILYQIMNKHQPASLKELMTDSYVVPYRQDTIIRKPYLEHVSVDGKGNILDPFGNPYLYDGKMGRVYSSTEGYRAW